MFKDTNSNLIFKLCSKDIGKSRKPKEHTDAITFLKLRKEGCEKKSAITFCKKNFCRYDHTREIDGPSQSRVLKPKKKNNLHIYKGWDVTGDVNFKEDQGKVQKAYEDILSTDKLYDTIEYNIKDKEMSDENSYRWKLNNLHRYYTQISKSVNKPEFSDREQTKQWIEEKSEEVQDELRNHRKYVHLNEKDAKLKLYEVAKLFKNSENEKKAQNQDLQQKNILQNDIVSMRYLQSNQQQQQAIQIENNVNSPLKSGILSTMNINENEQREEESEDKGQQLYKIEGYQQQFESPGNNRFELKIINSEYQQQNQNNQDSGLQHQYSQSQKIIKSQNSSTFQRYQKDIERIKVQENNKDKNNKNLVQKLNSFPDVILQKVHDKLKIQEKYQQGVNDHLFQSILTQKTIPDLNLQGRDSEQNIHNDSEQQQQSYNNNNVLSAKNQKINQNNSFNHYNSNIINSNNQATLNTTAELISSCNMKNSSQNLRSIQKRGSQGSQSSILSMENSYQNNEKKEISRKSIAQNQNLVRQLSQQKGGVRRVLLHQESINHLEKTGFYTERGKLQQQQSQNMTNNMQESQGGYLQQNENIQKKTKNGQNPFDDATAYMKSVSDKDKIKQKNQQNRDYYIVESPLKQRNSLAYQSQQEESSENGDQMISYNQLELSRSVSQKQKQQFSQSSLNNKQSLTSRTSRTSLGRNMYSYQKGNIMKIQKKYPILTPEQKQKQNLKLIKEGVIMDPRKLTGDRSIDDFNCQLLNWTSDNLSKTQGDYMENEDAYMFGSIQSLQENAVNLQKNKVQAFEKLKQEEEKSNQKFLKKFSKQELLQKRLQAKKNYTFHQILHNKN